MTPSFSGCLRTYRIEQEGQQFTFRARLVLSGVNHSEFFVSRYKVKAITNATKLKAGATSIGIETTGGEALTSAEDGLRGRAKPLTVTSSRNKRRGGSVLYTLFLLRTTAGLLLIFAPASSVGSAPLRWQSA